MSKILEKIVAKRLTAHIEEQLLSNDVQSACIFIHTGPMIQHHLQEKYMHSSQVAHR